MTEEVRTYEYDDEIVISRLRYIDYYREEYYDDLTLMRVYLALCEAGVDEATATKAMNVMLDHGILFRERKPRP